MTALWETQRHGAAEPESDHFGDGRRHFLNAEAQRHGATEPQSKRVDAKERKGRKKKMAAYRSVKIFKTQRRRGAEIAEGRGKGRPRVIDAKL